MPQKTDWKVYDRVGEFVGATKAPDMAAVLVATLGEGASIRWKHHTIVWKEGAERQPAGESYDYVGMECIARVTRQRRTQLALAEFHRRLQADSQATPEQINMHLHAACQLHRAQVTDVTVEYNKAHRAKKRRMADQHA